MTEKRKLLLGIAAALVAGFFWGMVFLAPQVLTDFSPIEIAYGRFFFFGLLSLTQIGRVKAIVSRLSPRDMLLVLCLSGAGFWLYTILLVWSVQYSGGVVTTLAIGLLPITISLVSKKALLRNGRFIAGLGLILLGLLVLKAGPLLIAVRHVETFSVTGSACLAACLTLWTWYGIKNSAFLKQRSWISKRDFTSLIGIVALICMSLICAVMIDFPRLIHHEHFRSYMMWSALLGLGSTWLAYWLWNICSAFCPPHISGPLIVFETVFGVLFTFLYQGRLPTLNEGAAIALFMLGAFLAINSEFEAAQQPAVPG